MAWLEYIFWLCIALNVVTFLVYPAALILIAGVFGRSTRRTAVDDSHQPSVSVIICAHNEAAVIAEKIRTVLGSRYEGEIEVLVGDDGSTDDTADIAAAIDDARVIVKRFARSGKAHVLDALARAASGDIFVFSDADPKWRDDTLQALAAPFADPDVGAVAGNVLTSKAFGRLQSGDQGFRRYENLIRRAETRLFGAISADGGLFAIRRSDYDAPPPGATDDFFISTGTVMRGRRIVFSENAIAIENSIPSVWRQFRRRMRITVRGLESVWRRRALLNPFRYGGYAVALFFHKVLRRAAPAMLVIAAAILTPLAAMNEFYRLLALAGASVLAISLATIFLQIPRAGVLRIPAYGVLHLSGLAAGFFMFLLGVRFTKWTPAPEKNAAP